MKRSITGYTRADLLKKARIKHNTVFNRRFDKVNKHYGLVTQSINPFKEEIDNENSPYEIPLEVVDLLSTLLYSIEFNPFFRTNADDKKIEAYNIIDFYKTLIKEVENFPLFEKYKIKEHPAYLNTIKEIEILPKLIKKLSESIVALEEITQQERGDIMIHIYQKLDEWVFNAFINNSLDNKAKLSNYKNVQKNLNEELDGTTITQESINTLDELIVERIKMWTGLIGENPKEIKKNVLRSKDRKKSIEEYIQELSGIEGYSVGVLRESIEKEIIDEYYDGMFETHRNEIDDLINHIKENKCEEKLTSYKATEKYKKWRNADTKERKEYITQWKEFRITKLKAQIKALEETLYHLENDGDFSIHRVTEEMNQLERYLEFEGNIKNSKRYERASNLFFGQLISQNFKR